MGAIRIGMGQMLVECGQVEANLERACRLIGDAAAVGCAAVVLPECLDAGWTCPLARRIAEPIPGSTSEKLAAHARKHSIYVVAGITERDADRIYNAAVLIDPKGEIIGRHRKINELFIAHELYSLGDSLSVVETGIGRIGLTICADNFPDSLVFGHALARMGAQMILSPCAWAVDANHDNAAKPYGSLWMESYSTLGRMYDITVVGVSSVGRLTDGPWKGRKCIGNSLAVGPGGSVLAIGSFGEFAQELITVDVEPIGLLERGTEISARLKRMGFSHQTGE
jgi:predicted amidohydrolase